MSLKEDATTVTVLRALSLRPLPGGTREISRAWRCGDLDLYRMLPLEGTRP